MKDFTILERMAKHFLSRGDALSLDTLKFSLLRPVYKAQYGNDKLSEFARKQEAFLQKCGEAGSVILYGAGAEGAAYLGELRRNGVTIPAFMDTFKTGVFCGVPIISMEDYREQFADTTIAVTPMLHKRKIKRQLEAIGIDNVLCSDIDSPLLDSDIITPETEMLFSRANGEQYFSLAEIPWGEEEVFVDCGVFDGESTLDFISRCEKRGGTYSKVFGFEPDPSNYLRAVDNLARSRGVKIFNAGVGNHDGTEKFVTYGPCSRVGEAGIEEVRVVTLDKALESERVTFIKMDIEGSELDALRGAAKIIRAQKPKLAVCVYHKFEDNWEIPEFIWSLNPEYQLFMRHYSKGLAETVLYALPQAAVKPDVEEKFI
ncbi:MAG: FkbM family methyltransferase [Synergistaceae bacterium]|jgi:FkbM family methyltransferase|nr:FkbM family methyltransferase [Synergistaceae bacterium]